MAASELPSLPFTARPRVGSKLLLFFGALVFVAGGIALGLDGKAMGWACAGFFGLCLLVALAQLHPRSTSLTVTSQGIEYTNLFRRRVLRWDQVESFGSYSIQVGFAKAAEQVGIILSDPNVTPARATSRSLCGFDGALPDTYGFKAAKLAELLNRLRAQHGPPPPAPSIRDVL